MVNTAPLERMMIPPVHWWASFDKIPPRCKHRAELRKYFDNYLEHVRKPLGLLLFGDYSTGKSAIAAIALKKAFFEFGVIGLWISARDIPSFQIEKTLFDDEQTMIDRAKTVRLLVIDEYVHRKDIRYTEQACEMLVRGRIEQGLCTILTTNHTPEYLAEWYPSMIEAMRQAFYPIKVQGHNFRHEKAKTHKV